MYVLFPAILAVILSMRSPGRALVYLYLPVLFLLPPAYKWDLNGLPDPDFVGAAGIPILIAALAAGGWKWRFSMTDVLVLAVAGLSAFAEFTNNGFDITINLAFSLVCDSIVPYALAKLLIERDKIREAVAASFALTLSAIAVLSIYEFVAKRTLFEIAGQRLFGLGIYGNWTQERWGFARTAGPFTHAIIAGMLYAIGLSLLVWVAREERWSEVKRWLKLPFTKSRAVMLMLLLGLAMTLSRGPWLSAFIAVGIAMVGRASNVRRAFFVALGTAAILGGALFFALKQYASGDMQDEARASAAYRFELMDQYYTMAWGHTWGMGTITFPRAPSMPSIDNDYLLTMLRYGPITAAAFILLQLLTLVQLARAGLRAAAAGSPDTPLYFTLLGSLCAIGLGIITVYLGGQLGTVLYLLIGWADALVSSPPRSRSEAATPESPKTEAKDLHLLGWGGRVIDESTPRYIS